MFRDQGRDHVTCFQVEISGTLERFVAYTPPLPSTLFPSALGSYKPQSELISALFHFIRSSSSSLSSSLAVMTRVYLLVLLGLFCLQYFSAAQNAKGPEDCCFKFFVKPIPITAIRTYENTSNDCPKNGIIFTTQKTRVCVDPGFKWVQRAINLLDQRLYANST
ncbi:C-C motif chemokine 26 [Bagarius yarrelli]|uniref:C-C motif chemokine n=1 Tax=Bagarius yarrelli TaxID=175774 RepID=A0A556V916_BAGYA|nr:C-C motif chemokine 26 [Bagarius yarrelli]